VVTLGTPHRGTLLGVLGLPFALLARSLVQMIPGSPFLARLQDGPWPAQVRLVSIWSRGIAVRFYRAAMLRAAPGTSVSFPIRTGAVASPSRSSARSAS